MKNPLIQKKYSHSRQYGKRVNLLSISIALLIGTIFYIIPNDYGTEIYAQPNDIQLKEVVETRLTKADIENKIKFYFPRSWPTMIPIAYAESGLNINAKGYNCYYNQDKTIVYATRVKGSHSTACKPSHRSFAYSVDCNVLQRNVKGQVCPKKTLDEHLKEVADLSRVQGLQAWSSFNQGKHLAYTK